MRCEWKVNERVSDTNQVEDCRGSRIHHKCRLLSDHHGCLELLAVVSELVWVKVLFTKIEHQLTV